MPSIRKLRNRDILSDDFEEFGAEPSADPFAAQPDKPVSGIKHVQPQRQQSMLAAATSDYVCDITLPKKGLEVPNKVLLLNLLDANGGPQSSGYKSRYLNSICIDHPDELGVPGSERRKQVKWLVDRWKRDTDFATTRSKLMTAFSSLSPKSKQIKTPFKDNKKPAAEEVSSQPTVKSPPPITRKAAAAPPKKETTKMAPASSKMSSPLRFFRSKTNLVKGMCFCFHSLKTSVWLTCCFTFPLLPQNTPNFMKPTLTMKTCMESI